MGFINNLEAKNLLIQGFETNELLVLAIKKIN